jgi:hypothetical protein
MITTAAFAAYASLCALVQRRPHIGAAVLLKPLGCLALGVEHHQLDPVGSNELRQLVHLTVVAELHHIIPAVHLQVLDVNLVRLARLPQFVGIFAGSVGRLCW